MSAFRRWARAATARPARVTVRVVNAAEGKKLNQDFRRRDYATNVLTFVYGKDNGVLAGDLVLCAPVVAREAREQGKPVAAHYAHLLVHGMLHLQGYDHEEDGEAERMENRERRILKSLGYADPYAMPMDSETKTTAAAAAGPRASKSTRKPASGGTTKKKSS
ncbi:MAG TPA: rRNA maturation RNase YbeY [Burkholderiales bacterium]|nr:rRNA maturation RNase YbeY [Burkholderiales bacterium]